MSKSESVDLLRYLDDQTGGHRRLERLEQLVLLALGRDGLQLHQAEVVSQHRGESQHVDRGARQLIQATADQMLDGRRHLLLGGGARAAEQFLDEERVATRLAAQPQQRLVIDRVAAGMCSDQSSGFSWSQAGEMHRIGLSVESEVGQRVASAQLPIVEGGHDEQA